MIELAIVIAILAIVIAMAVPGFLNARKTANEGSAVGSLRSLVTTSTQFKTRTGIFAPTLADLLAGGFIDSVLASGMKSGYTFSYAGTGPETWTCTADPTTPGSSGDRSFFVDESGVIRNDAGGAAGPASSPIE